MMKRFDGQKIRQWKERFKRFRSSGLTVEQFCSNERVSANTFYYWRKRVESGPATVRVTQCEQVFDRFGQAGRRASSDAVTPNNEVVHFRFHAAEISVPANCLDVIRCLTVCAQHAQLEGTQSFHEVRPRHSIATE